MRGGPARAWLWFARCEDRPEGAHAAAEVTDLDGRPAGHLAAWSTAEEPFDGALKISVDAVDPDGRAGWVSLSLAPRPRWLPFDDQSVTRALQTVLLHPTADVVSTLQLGDARFVGALVGVHGDDRRRLDDDPFARLFPATLLAVGPGLLGVQPPPVGPGTQRNGSSNPWPGGQV